MSAKLEPTDGEFPEIKPDERVMKMRCSGKGEALWARFTLLYPIIITSRKYLGHLLNGAAQDVEIMAVKVDGKMHKGLPSHVGAGVLDIIVQAKGSTSIEIELMCRVDLAAGDEPAEAESVADAIARLEAEPEAEHEPRPEDPPVRPPPVDPRGETKPRPELEMLPQPDLLTAEGPFPADLPPEVAAQATADLSKMLLGPDMDEATRKSLQAFIDADGDPTETLRGMAPEADAPERKRKLEPVA